MQFFNKSFWEKPDSLSLSGNISSTTLYLNQLATEEILNLTTPPELAGGG